MATTTRYRNCTLLYTHVHQMMTVSTHLGAQFEAKEHTRDVISVFVCVCQAYREQTNTAAAAACASEYILSQCFAGSSFLFGPCGAIFAVSHLAFFLNRVDLYFLFSFISGIPFMSFDALSKQRNVEIFFLKLFFSFTFCLSSASNF